VTSPDRDNGSTEHGDVFGRGWGSMFIHVQRESGLAHRTLVLRPWQVQALRLMVSRWFALVLSCVVLSWMYFAVQTARMPFLTKRIAHLERDAAKIDTLQATLEQLQRRYDQVQQMLSASTRPAVSDTKSDTKSNAKPDAPTPASRAGTSEKGAPAAEKPPGEKAPVKVPPKAPPLTN
jgi:hypothetical protein